MRIMYIVPFPFDADGLSHRDAGIPRDVLAAGTEVDCVPVHNSAGSGSTYYDSTLLDMYVTEAGLSAEEEGYDAVIIDTMADSGLHALRSRLSIPVIGPGLVAYSIASILGRRFSIITYLEEHVFHYEKNLAQYGLASTCASVRASHATQDVEKLFAEHRGEFDLLIAAAEAAVRDDGANVIILGSTTMHEAGRVVAERLKVPVINPGPVAIKITEALVALGLSHSKQQYPTPPVLQDEIWHSLPAAEPGTKPWLTFGRSLAEWAELAQQPAGAGGV